MWTVMSKRATEQSMYERQRHVLLTTQRRERQERLLRHVLHACSKQYKINFLLRGLSALRRNVAECRANESNRTTGRLNAKAERLKNDMQRQVNHARMHAALLHVSKCWQSWKIRRVSKALKRWHLATVQTRMNATLAQAQFAASKLLQQAQEATATQHESVRRAHLRSMLVRWRRRQLTCGFNALQAAMLSARTEVLILTFFNLL